MNELTENKGKRGFTESNLLFVIFQYLIYSFPPKSEEGSGKSESDSSPYTDRPNNSAKF